MVEVFKKSALQQKAVLVCLLRRLNIFHEYFVASAPSGPFRHCFQMFFQLMTSLIYLKEWRKQDSLRFHGSADHILDMNTGSDRHYRTERVWLVRLSQQFLSISKSRCSPLRTSIN